MIGVKTADGTRRRRRRRGGVVEVVGVNSKAETDNWAKLQTHLFADICLFIKTFLISFSPENKFLAAPRSLVCVFVLICGKCLKNLTKFNEIWWRDRLRAKEEVINFWCRSRIVVKVGHFEQYFLMNHFSHCSTKKKMFYIIKTTN